MNRALQAALLWLYARVQATGLLKTGLGRWLFEALYDVYKERLEAACADHLQALVPRGSTVIDVGANVGFFTRRFARWTGADGKVIALEPEAHNIQRLQWAINREHLEQVEIVQAAVGETSGSAFLRINAAHPGDHRLSDTGVKVPLVSLDDLLAARAWPKVSLIKIDVQGAEERVLRGAARTLAEIRPAWFVEIDDAHLRAMGSSAAAVLEIFTTANYRVCRVTRAGIGAALDPKTIAAEPTPGRYEDLLFTP